MKLVILIVIILIIKVDEYYFSPSNLLNSNFHISKLHNTLISTELLYLRLVKNLLEFVGIFLKTPQLPFLLVLHVIGNAGKVSFLKFLW